MQALLDAKSMLDENDLSPNISCVDKWEDGILSSGVMSSGEIEEEIRKYEQEFGMKTEEMLAKVEDGEELPDSFGMMDWRILAKHQGLS